MSFGESSQPPDLAHQSSHPFSEFFPPPYRVILLLALGVFCWGLDIHLLSRSGIDTEEVLSGQEQQKLPIHNRDEELAGGRRSRSISGNAASNLKSSYPGVVYAIAAALAGWALFNWAVFRTYVLRQEGDPSGRHAQALQGIAVLAVFAAGVWPGNVLWRAKRKQFGRALLPLFHPSLLLFRPPTFASILLADVLTSFAKVFGDVWLTACFLVPRREHHTWWNGRGSWIVPVLVSLPYAIRLLQCLAEWQYTDHSAMLGSTKGPKSRSRRPLTNAVKYASAFPVIWISASQSSRAGGVPSERNEPGLWNLWLLSVFINSLYSFWWDVTNDWGLEALKLPTWKTLASPTSSLGEGSKSLHRRGLSVWPAPRGNGNAEEDESEEVDKLLHVPSPAHGRSLSTLLLRASTPPAAGGNTPPTTMLFSPSVYHVAILLDLLLRFTWSLKLSPHLAQLVEVESGVFLLEVGEVLRRCGWVVLRVEWEVVKRSRAREMSNGVADTRLRDNSEGIGMSRLG